MLRRAVLLLIISALLCPPQAVELAFAGSMSSQYLCELGVTFYRMGKFEEALSEFNKVLLIEPRNSVAQKYINDIFQRQNSALEPVPAPVVRSVPVIPQARKTTYSSKRPVIDVAAQNARRDQLIDMTLVQFSNEQKVAEKPKMSTEPPRKKVEQPKAIEDEESEEGGIEVAGVRISGEAQVRLGFTPDDVIWNKAEWDLNEKNFRMLTDMRLSSSESTYDPRIYDRLRLDLDAGQEEGFAFHSNLMIDPWSFTGKSPRVTVTSGWGDTAEVQYLSWGNTGYTIQQIINTRRFGNSFILPESKIHDGLVEGHDILGGFWPPDTFSVPEADMEYTFQPVRELWFDYNRPEVKVRVFPIAYENQALTFDDPLVLSNNRIWWENSPWTNRWLPGIYNSGVPAPDFTKGYWDNSLSFFARDSEGRRLTELRGFTLSFTPQESTSIVTSVVTPKDPWQTYSDVDNLISATRIKQSVLPNVDVGMSVTTRQGFNEEGPKHDYTPDAWNYVVATDAGYEIADGIKVTAEIARSQSRYDISNKAYSSREDGYAYHFALLGRFPMTSIMDTQYGYDGILQEEGESDFTKFRFLAARMDGDFDPTLSSYVETRDDESWSRHLHFKRPFKDYYQGEGQTLTWDDVKGDAIGNGLDIGRSVLGFRTESSLADSKVENLFDVRNVHQSNGGKFIENVARDEFTWQVTDKLTSKVLGIYHRLPDSTGNIDPTVFDSRTRLPFINTEVEDGKDLAMTTGSLGLEYQFLEWLAVNGIWEYTNDISFAYENFPRGLLNSGSRGYLYTENGLVYREVGDFLFGQEHFPPYPYYNIWKTGLRLNPLENMEIYLDYTRNEYGLAGPVDDNMNGVGFEVGYTPMEKLSLYFRYNYSRWKDIDKFNAGSTDMYGHHNVFTELIYRRSKDEDITLQYGESSRNPFLGGVMTVGWDPYGGSLRTLDTRHIFRLYYRRKF